jgi:hypothetical protein
VPSVCEKIVLEMEGVSFVVIQYIDRGFHKKPPICIVYVLPLFICLTKQNNTLTP